MVQKEAGISLLLLIGLAVSARADDGARWFCRWEPTGLCYEVTVEKTENGKSFVRYTMDGTTEWVPQYRLGQFNVDAGDSVEVKWWKDKLYYRATVTRRNGDNITIRWDDGGSVEETPISQIRIKLIHPEGRQVGEAVLGRWEPNGWWYPGKIEEIRDGKYRVVYDAGDESWLPAAQVLPYLPTFGDQVEAKWSRDGLYYKARLSHRDGHKVRVTWEDGTSEESTMDKLRMDADKLVIRSTK
ncbi:MAG: tudor domain-containing protein [Pirellulaceae bacterium]